MFDVFRLCLFMFTKWWKFQYTYAPIVVDTTSNWMFAVIVDGFVVVNVLTKVATSKIRNISFE